MSRRSSHHLSSGSSGAQEVHKHALQAGCRTCAARMAATSGCSCAMKWVATQDRLGSCRGTVTVGIYHTVTTSACKAGHSCSSDTTRTATIACHPSLPFPPTPHQRCQGRVLGRLQLAEGRQPGVQLQAAGHQRLACRCCQRLGRQVAAQRLR